MVNLQISNTSYAEIFVSMAMRRGKYHREFYFIIKLWRLYKWIMHFWDKEIEVYFSS